MPCISFRQARTFLAVAETLCVTRAAELLVRSQTSVTKSLQELEKHIGVALFERSSRGVTLSPQGETLLPHVREAAETFRRAEQLLASRGRRDTSAVRRFFGMDVSDKWLDAFIALAEHKSVASAAAHLNLTPAAITSSLRKLEDSLGVGLFERTPNVIVPTSVGTTLLEHAKLARNQLRSGVDELFSAKGEPRGRVRVGTLPFVQTMILPRAIIRLLNEHSQLRVSTMEGPYDDLLTSLRSGDIDFFVGALRGAAADPAVKEERLLDHRLSVIVRKGHELDRKRVIDWSDLLRHQWVLPIQGTRIREILAEAMRRKGVCLPSNIIETSSFATLRGLLLESNRLTILSRHQFYYEETHGLLTALPFDLQEEHRLIGITCRRHGSPSPGAALLMQKIREVAADVAPLIGSPPWNAFSEPATRAMSA